MSIRSLACLILLASLAVGCSSLSGPGGGHVPGDPPVAATNSFDRLLDIGIAIKQYESGGSVMLLATQVSDLLGIDSQGRVAALVHAWNTFETTGDEAAAAEDLAAAFGLTSLEPLQGVTPSPRALFFAQMFTDGHDNLAPYEDLIARAVMALAHPELLPR